MSSISISARNGMTLIELLIVIAIITLLLQIALPAVEMSREAARMAQCGNNLRQLGLAMQLHHNTHNRFPSGGWSWRWLGEPERGTDIAQPGSWAFNVLDFVEQDDLRRMGMGLTGEARSRAIVERCKTPISLFICPSRRLPRPFRQDLDWVPLTTNDDYKISLEWAARSDYAANSGSYGHGCPDHHLGPDTLAIGDDPDYAWYDNMVYTGIVYGRSRVEYRHVTDGLSKTYIIGEKSMNFADYTTGLNSGDNENLHTGFNDDTCRSTKYLPIRDTQFDREPTRFGSAHQWGLQMIFCDGSVHSISYDVEASVHSALGHKSDGGSATSPSGD